MTTPLDLRHEGQAAVIAADTAPHRGYAHYFRDAIETLSADGLPFSVDVIRTVAKTAWLYDGNGAFDPAPNLLPAVIGGYAAAGRIVRCNEYHSDRKSRKYGRNGVYRAA